MTKPDYIMSTYIRCTQDALWDALTDAGGMTHFHFMADRIERQGNRIVYFMPGGAQMLVMAETQVTPKTRIESTFEPCWEGPGMAASRFVYMIAPEAAHCRLTLEHYDLPASQSAGVADGWSRMLSGLKTWLETGSAVPFSQPMPESAEA